MLDFINPLLECQDSAPLGVVRIGLSERLQALLDERKKQGSLSDAAVYYRDLNNGPWFGVDEKEAFSPASLMKVPLLMAYFKHAEADPSLFMKKLQFTRRGESIDQNIPPAERLAPGVSYTIKDLLYRMVVHSDNDATAVLFQNDGEHYFEEVFSALRLPIPDGAKDWRDYRLRVKDYAAFFRILYNASYLSEDSSNKALALLSLVKFNKGLPAGVPKDVSVAHKFGERGDGGERQFHDCGIVYHPRAPYLLCAMTRGRDLVELTSITAEISSLVYKEVDRQTAERQ